MDSSALAKRYLPEPQKAEIEQLALESVCFTSQITEVEVASAIHRQAREGRFLAPDRDRALAKLSEDIDSLIVVGLDGEIVALARSLLERHALRASDSIQLASAIAARSRFPELTSLLSFDGRLDAAAQAEGFEIGPPG